VGANTGALADRSHGLKVEGIKEGNHSYLWGSLANSKWVWNAIMKCWNGPCQMTAQQ